MGGPGRVFRSLDKGLDEIRSIQIDDSLGDNQSEPMLLE